VGDIETNYGEEKVRQVKPAAMMVKRYAESLPPEEQSRIIRRIQKMVLGVGADEVAALEKRYEWLSPLFPTLEKLNAEGIAHVEPEVMRGRAPEEPILALFNPEGYAVNYGELAQSLATHAQDAGSTRTDTFYGHEVVSIQKDIAGDEGPYTLTTKRGTIRARVVIVSADAYSLGFAKSLGYGKEFSLIPIAGTFFFSPERLRGKVYRVQDPRMPFAAVHGDPEMTRGGFTRWGPTARFYPVLEAGRFSTIWRFFASSGFERPATWASFISILLDPVRFWYLLRNFFYDLPIIGRHLLVPQIRAMIPTMRASELTRARGYGGMRLQRVDTRTRELLLGEGKIVGERIIFNMTPSPGASVCLYNAMRDAEAIAQFFPAGDYRFDKSAMLHDLCENGPANGEDVSQRETYVS
jgi:malate dehydrogenase (quinone)